MSNPNVRSEMLTELEAALRHLKSLDLLEAWPERASNPHQREASSNWTDFMLDGWEAAVDLLRRWTDEQFAEPNNRSQLEGLMKIMARDLLAWQSEDDPPPARAAMAKAEPHFVRARRLFGPPKSGD